MRERQSFIPAVLAELSRRKVLRTLGAYAVGVFVVLQLMDAAVDPLRLPDWLPTLVVVGLILGFPLVFGLAWQFDITGEGIRRTEPGDALSSGQRTLLFGIMMLATAAMGVAFYRYYAGVFNEPPVASLAASPAGSGAARGFAAPENSIAVLPFADLSEAGGQAYLSDGIAEEILNLLAQVEGLHVAARTSSFAFRNPQQDIRGIGRALNVRTVLEGSVRTAGNRIRMTAQLINVEDGYHIWSQTFDRELTDLFALQDEVASAIATALVESFAGLTPRPTARTSDLAAFEAYRTGRLHWWRRSPQELQKAIDLFAQALQHDAGFAPAYAALADSMILLSLYGNIGQLEAIDRAMPNIERALAIDPGSAEAFAALGLARMQIEQHDAAESALRQAIALNGDYVPARLWLANLLGEQGRIPEQGRVLEEAMALDPLNELLAINYAGNMQARGDHAGARELLDGLVALRPDSATLLRTLAVIAMGSGDLVGAWEHAHDAWRLEPDNPVVIQSLAKVWMELGDLEESERLLQHALELAADNADLKVSHFLVLYAGGRMEEAELVVRDLYGDDPQALPEHMQRYFHFHLGLLRLRDGDLTTARDEFERSINPELQAGFENDQLFAMTMAATLNHRLGEEVRANEQLAQAEQGLHRAEVNGLETAEVFYTRSVVQACKGERQRALESLRTAYQMGFRQGWVLDIDLRLDSLRGTPEFESLRHDIENDLRRALAEVRSQQVAML